MNNDRLAGLRFINRSKGVVKALCCTCLVVGFSSAAEAFQLDTGNSEVRMRWDNTVKYSSAWRLEDPSATLTADPNLDDGDLNFDKGLISSRLDLLSEFDLIYKNMGLRLSGAAWKDTEYSGRNDHPDNGTVNHTSVPYNQFTEETKDLHGQDAELLDAFVFGRFDMGDKPTTVRLGRHSLVWGETLFFGANGIAGGMMPVDVNKLQSVPNTQFKEAIRPVSMLSGQVQLSDAVSLAAYAQFEWEHNLLPASGSYFSWADHVPDGGEQIVAPGPGPGGLISIPRGTDQQASDSGQGGLQLRILGDETDYGLYLIRYHSKSFQVVSDLAPTGAPAPAPAVAPASYHLAYHEDITALGASFSHTFGDVNLAGEFSMRQNQDLAQASGAVDTSALGGAATDNKDNPAYPVGDTVHLNVSAFWSLQPSDLFPEAVFLGELAWNRVTEITKNEAAVDPNATRSASALRFIFEPSYRQVASGVDLSVPIGLGWAPRGSRSMALGSGAFPAEGGGDISIGVKGTYLDAWRFSVSYTHYYGDEKPFTDSNNQFTYGQSLADRDFIALSVYRTF